jgi:hypothetical protein
MARSAKTVSIRHLHSAVKSALEAAKKQHPNFKLDPATPSPGLPIAYRPGWICGYPIFLPAEVNLKQIDEFNNTFVGHLASNPQLSALGVDGKFEPAVYVTGGQGTIGFVSADAALVE